MSSLRDHERTDAAFEEQKARIMTLIGKWEALMGLGHWRIEYEFLREDMLPIPDRGYPTDWVCFMRTTPSWDYMYANIEFSTFACAAIGDVELEEDLVHEYCHILVNEMHEWGPENDKRGHEERVVTQLAKAFRWTWRAGAGQMAAATDPVSIILAEELLAEA